MAASQDVTLTVWLSTVHQSGHTTNLSYGPVGPGRGARMEHGSSAVIVGVVCLQGVGSDWTNVGGWVEGGFGHESLGL